jgi:hypothetical protein
VPATTVVSSVSTATVDAADRLAYWEQYNAEALVGLTCRAYADEGLVASALNLDLGGFRVAEIAGNAHVVERGPALVRAYPKEAAFVSLVLEGTAFFYDQGGCVSLRPGDVVAYRTDDPYLFGFSTSMRKVLVDVPRALFDDRCSAEALGRPLVVAGDVPRRSRRAHSGRCSSSSSRTRWWPRSRPASNCWTWCSPWSPAVGRR